MNNDASAMPIVEDVVFDSNVLVNHEKFFLNKTHLARWPERSGDSPWCGIALSGGGIRSATFCLGALQSLAAHNLLKRFDFLSSVSGGGYTASGLQWWWSRERVRRELEAGSENSKAFGQGRDDFPYGTRHPDPNVGDSNERRLKEPPILTYLRAHGRYLTPGDGITAWSGIAVVLRTLMLNLFIWTFLTTLAFFLLIWLSFSIWPATPSSSILRYVPSPLLVPTILAASCGNLKDAELLLCDLSLPLVFVVAIYACYLLFGLFFLWTVGLAYLASIRNITGSLRGVATALLLASALFAASTYVVYTIPTFWADSPTLLFETLLMTGGVAFLLSAWASRRQSDIEATYIWFRRFDKYAAICLLVALAFFGLGLVPIMSYGVVKNLAGIGAPSTAALVAVLSGSVTAIQGYFALLRNSQSSMANRIIAPVAALLFLGSMLVTAYLLAMIWFMPENIVLGGHNNGIMPVIIRAGFGLAVSLAIGLSWIVRVNVIGLHRYYRDRLMEAFMPTTASVVEAHSGFSPIADRLAMGDLLFSVERPEVAGHSDTLPAYPIINTNAILVNDPNPDFMERGGDSFIFTPYFIGSRATGWMRTAEFESRHQPITLASAMTASAAAANANAAYVGRGLTRNRLISLLMALLNLRLGLWVANPRQSAPVSWLNLRSWLRPNNLYAGLACSLLGRGYRHDSLYVELSDGGHFDNLGLYELIRRRAQLIIVVDGEADKETNFPALTSVLRRISKDFPDVKISFDSMNGPERLVATTASKFPSGTFHVREPYFVARIEYQAETTPANREGAIIYCKAAMLADLSLSTKGYMAANRDFPHEPTINQFFSPDQFESYRELGYECMRRVITELKLETIISTPAEILCQPSSKGLPLSP